MTLTAGVRMGPYEIVAPLGGAARAGSQTATAMPLEGLIPVVYGELRRIADRYFCHELAHLNHEAKA